MEMNPKRLVQCLAIASAAALPAATTEIVSQSFEAAAADAAASSFTVANVMTWSGYATVTTGSCSYDRSETGYPITPSPAHDKVLAVNGELTLSRPANPTAEPAMVDMMVQAVVPEDTLELPSGTTPQIAVGVDKDANDNTKAALKVYCIAPNGSAGTWVLLKGDLAADSWHRVSFLCDYTNGRCQIRIDGEPCVTANGYLQATGTTTTGSWYALANSGTALNGLKVLGLTQIDDVVVKSGSDAASSYSVAGQTGGVDNSWFDQYGLAWNASATYENESGLNAGQKFAVGLEPFSTTKVKISGMSMGGSGSTFTVPSMGKATQLAVSSSPNFTEKQVVSIPANTTSVTATLDKVSGDVNYFRLESTDGSTVTGVNTCGWVKITSTLENTVIGVPWVEVDTASAIKVANLVKIDNLTAGDYLYLYLGNSWYAYKLEGGAWVATTTVSTTGPKAAQAPENQTIARGAALFIQRQNPTDGSGNAIPFYVYGQYTNADVATTVTANAYTLCANPKAEAFNLNGGKIGTPNANDSIIVPQANGSSLVYTYNGSTWGSYTKTSTERTIGGKTYTFDQQTWTAAPVIPLGQGFWYVSKGGTPTINW